MRCVLIVLTMMIGILSHDGMTHADEPDFPKTLLGFIKPGMLIGLRASQSDSLVSVEIYDEEQFRFAMDARHLKLDELEKKYPSVSEKAAEALANYQSSPEARASGNVKGTNFVREPSIELDVDRTTTLCTVLHVDDDYFLVTYGDDSSKKRQVIAKQAVNRIRWASDDVRFKTSLRTIRRAD